MANKAPITDIIKDSTNKTMKKIDGQVPLYVKMNTDIYRANDRLAETFIEMCYSMEGLVPGAMMHREMLRAAKVEIRLLSEMIIAEADVFEGFLKMYPQMYVYGVKYFEQAMRGWAQVIEAASRQETEGEPEAADKK